MKRFLYWLRLLTRPSFNIDTSKPFTKDDARKVLETIKYFGDIYENGVLKVSLDI